MVLLPLPIIQSTLLTHTFCILACIALAGTFLTVARWVLYEAPTIETLTYETVAQTILQVPSYLANGVLSLFCPARSQQDVQANQANLRDYAKFLVATFAPRKALPAPPTSAKHQMDSWIPSFGSGLLTFVWKLPTIPMVWAHRIALKSMPLMLPAPPVVMEPVKKPKRSLFYKIWMTFRTILECFIMKPMATISGMIQWIRFVILPVLFAWIVKPLCTTAIPAILKIMVHIMVLVTPTILGCLLEALVLLTDLLICAGQHKYYDEIVECLQAIGLKPSDFGTHQGLEKQFCILKKAYKNKCRKVHPDKGGTDEAFRKVNESFERLKKFKVKRQITTFCI